MPNAAQIIELNVSLRLFIKPGVDANAIAKLVDEHFGKGEAIAGSGYEEELASALKDAVISDVAASDERSAQIVRDAVDSVDLWRDERKREDQGAYYETHQVS